MQGVERTSDEINDLKRAMLEYLLDSFNGTFTAACAFVKVNRTTAYQWRDEDPDFADAVRRAQAQGLDNGLDLAENKLMSKIGEGDRKSIFYFLDRKGGARGYNPKLTSIHTGPDGLPLPPSDPPVFNVTFPTNADVPTPSLPAPDKPDGA